MGMIKSAVKWILIAFVVLIVLGVLFGGSDNQTTTEQKKSTTNTTTDTQPANTIIQPSAQSADTIAETEMINTETSAEQSVLATDKTSATEEVYQDGEWITSSSKYSPLLEADKPLLPEGRYAWGLKTPR